MHKDSDRDINIEDALNLKDAYFVDVRSPGEYQEACIPGAVNVPLLDDEERRITGILYRQESPEKARTEALSRVLPKLPGLVEKFRDLSGEKPVILYCWRGGMRSSSLASFLDIMGVPVRRLTGGFKAYRRYVNNYLSQELKQRVIVIHGLTGVGKTEVIQLLQDMDVAAVDLEQLASNRGSVFGNVGMDSQPSQKMFEGLLAGELKKYEPYGYVVVEGESRRIGRLILPERLFGAMNAGVSILLYCSMDKRIERIKRIYTEGPDENIKPLQKSVEALRKRLGNSKVDQLQEMIRDRNYDEAVRILLADYYDPLYDYPIGPSEDFDFCIDSGNTLKAAGEIKKFINHNFRR